MQHLSIAALKPKPASDAALKFGMAHAAAYFKGRKGHGGGPVGKVVLTQEEMAAVMALSFDAGSDHAESN